MRLEDFKLERYFSRYEHAVPHLLCASDCETWSTAELLRLEPGAESRYLNLRLGYTEPGGAPSLRAQIAALYESPITADHVIVHVGAQEAIFAAMNVLLTSEDHVVVHKPCYQSLEEVARAIGCNVDHWQAQEKHGWKLDLEELKRLVNPRTKLVVVNSPHNPTGSLFEKSFFTQLIQFSRDRGLYLFCDEVYRGLEYAESARLPAGATLYERAISLGVMSKAYGLAGLRIGWLASQDKKFLSAVSAYKDYLTICAPGPAEFLAELALRHQKKVRLRCLELVLENLEHLNAFLAKNSARFSWTEPRAGVIGFVRYLEKEPVNAFCERLLAGTGALLLPGEVYEMPEHFRVGFGRKDFSVAIEKVEKFLRANS